MTALSTDLTAASLSDPMTPTPFRVARSVRETSDTFTLTLDPPDSMNGFAFGPGQFNMLYVFGVGESAISICGDADLTGRLTHTIRSIGTVTQALKKLRPGDMVGVRGPFGTPWPVDAARGSDVLFIAGGIGLAPLRPAIYRVLKQRQQYGRVGLIYGARTPDDLIYRKEIGVWSGQADLQTRVTVDRADRSWTGEVGVAPRFIDQMTIDPEDTVALVCGPEIMMRFTVLKLQERGVSLANIYVSMERNMKCAIGFCGHCQYGSQFICKDGPVFPFDRIRQLFDIREI